MTNDPVWIALIASACGIAIYVAVLAVALRVAGQRYALVLLASCAAVVLALTTAWAHANASMSYWHFFAFFGGGVAVTVFLYGLAAKSVSLRMLVHVAETPKQSATITELSKGVIATLFADRIRMLEEKGLICRGPEGYNVTPAGASAASRMRGIQQALKITSSGLYSS
jgi:hypothetical protein